MPRTKPPSAAVLRAFGAQEPPIPLPGGMGATWRSGQLVLKRSDAPPAWCEWEAGALAAVQTDRVRVQRVRRALDGACMVDGWVARDFLPGSHHPGRWTQIIDAGDALHAALESLPAHVARPPSESRDDAWAIADRVAWDELAIPTRAAFDDEGLMELLDARRPVVARPQLVHGDLTGNVLFSEDLAPGIIDFSPYWRPTAYAIGIVVSDAIVWEGAGVGLIAHVAARPEMGQCLVRALIFRHLAALLLPRTLPAGEAAQRYAALRNAAIELSKS